MTEDNKDSKDSKSDNTDLENNTLVWSKDVDTILAKWCDEAKCYEWMHAESYDKYNKIARQILLSLNILTALAGIGNVVTGSFNFNDFQTAWLFGSITIIISSVNFIQDKFSFQQRAEKHLRLSTNWCIIKNKIEEIVYLPYHERRDCKTFMKIIKTDINQNILDGNNLIPEDIKDACLSKFKDISNFNIPDICGQIEHTAIYIGYQPLTN